VGQQGHKREYYQVKDVQNDFKFNKGDRNIFFSIHIYKDSDYIILERTAFSIGDWLVKIGGLSRSLIAFGFALSALFSRKLFVASIMSK